MHYQKAKKYAIGRLHKELPSNLYYHGIHHTLDVCQAAQSLAEQEKVGSEERTLIATAALFHDIGFIEQYLDNEPIACRIATDYLPKCDYNVGQVKQVCDMIMATRLPQSPLSKLAEILCDADLDYLGREDFFEIADTLKREWMQMDFISSDTEWNKKQLGFLSSHTYFTESAMVNRDVGKQTNFLALQKILGI